jgi:hypothetical protein
LKSLSTYLQSLLTYLPVVRALSKLPNSYREL